MSSGKAFEEKYKPFQETTAQKISRILGLPAIKEYTKEIWQFGTGKVGLILFFILLGISIAAAVTMPPNFTQIWTNPKKWETNPQAVPPEWIKYFGYPVAPHRVIVTGGENGSTGFYKKKVNISGIIYTFKVWYVNYTVQYNLPSNAFPTDMLINIYKIKVLDRYKIYNISRGPRYAMPQVEVDVLRPDGLNLTLYKGLPSLQGNKTINGVMYAYVVNPLPIRPDRSLLTANTTLSKFYAKYGVKLKPTDVPGRSEVTHFIFGKPVAKAKGANATIDYKPLRGTYKIIVRFISLPAAPSDTVVGIAQKILVVVKGNAYGLMGTDNLGRDLAIGLYYGFPIAMAIGVVVAFVDTVIGLVLGVISGYYGGWVDEVIQRTVDIIGNIPLLPILILIAEIAIQVYSQPIIRLWIIMITLIVFSWGGLTIVIRSMALSIKSEPYIEAARCLGASNKRIIFLHIMPQVIPYAVASMVFAVPSAILAEAGLSVLGIVHGYPTWGLILASAREYGRIDQWWWIMPPGLLIAITAFTFVLLGMALERIVEPRLRTR
jgi:ABC-type dipeptide/oligopeptide/nickel transport system permease subunit